MAKKALAKKARVKKTRVKKTGAGKIAAAGPRAKKAAIRKAEPAVLPAAPARPVQPGAPAAASADVLDRLYAVVESRRDADPEISHSARLLARGTTKIAQKFGEEAVECLIEAVDRNPAALVGESADVLYHMLVMWLDAGIRPAEVWAELQRREGVSGIAEKASRARKLAIATVANTTKIP